MSEGRREETATTAGGPPTEPVWSFLWHREGEPESRWKVRNYRCERLETACERLARFLLTRKDSENIQVDYEVRALHRYNPKNRQKDEFVDLTTFENPLQDFVARS